MSRAARVAGDMWLHAKTFLPSDLDEIARRTGALTRARKADGEQLLRAFLIYAHVGSFSSASALAVGSGLVDMKPESLFYRLSHGKDFLSEVLARLVSANASAPCGFRIIIVDATTVSCPASRGTDWRVHVGYDPVRGVPCSVCATGPEVGESLRLHQFRPGDLVLGDRAYGTAKNYHYAVLQRADVLLRVQRRLIRLYSGDTKLDWANVESMVPAVGACSFDLRLPVPPDSAPGGSEWKSKDAIAWHNVRLIGARNRDGEVVWLLTNLGRDRLSDEQACELYRTRWQVELYFKRLKSLGDLGKLPTRDGPTAEPHLLSKLILLVLTSLLCDSEQGFSPYGYRVRAAETTERSKSVARVRMHAKETHLCATSQEPTWV